MLVKDLLNTDVEPIHSDDTVGRAEELMLEFNTEIMPFVDRLSNKLMGVVTKEAVSKLTDDNLDRITSLPFHAFPEQQLFEAAGVMIRNKIKFLPVIDHENHYLGVLKKRRVFDGLFQMLNITENGSMITVDIAQRDYMLSDIIRIIELEGAKILGVIIETPADTEGNIRVSVKMNLTEISAITSSLKRHGFIITAETRDEFSEFEFEQRADEFLRFLEI